jgi:hypothetical protein
MGRMDGRHELSSKGYRLRLRYRFSHNYARDHAIGNDYTPHRPAMDSAPVSRAQRAKLHKLIPEMRRFDSSMDTGYVPRDPATYYR